jgi:hypothetical protein
MRNKIRRKRTTLVRMDVNLKRRLDKLYPNVPKADLFNEIFGTNLFRGVMFIKEKDLLISKRLGVNTKDVQKKKVKQQR